DDEWKWKFRTTDTDPTGGAWPDWLLPLAIVGGILLVALIVVLFWIGSRGRFIFIDCVVHNRGRIVEPWREYRREGNSYFLFLLGVFAASLVVVALASLPLWLPFLLRGEAPQGAVFVAALIVLAVIAILAAIIIGTVMAFMAPIMYRRRCNAVEACRAAIRMITAEPIPVTLYILFLIVLYVAFVLVSCLITCVTCCVAAIPYVGTVILLPFHVFFLSYLLFFVRQFGPDYDVWATLPATTAPVAPSDATPPTPPPLSA
ncbi:MAG TPA: hypothetical protein VG095_06295, partial [Chthoniobacterales bacterium]|nr:hypothetical protein [Chthoniobacterales bacterium]